MSLLADLLEKTSATEVRAQVRTESAEPNVRTEQQAAGQQRGQVVELFRVRGAGLPSSPHSSAATATPEWRKARDAYINHLMACRSCYAPTARYCRAGADLRAMYDATPMETKR